MRNLSSRSVAIVLGLALVLAMFCAPAAANAQYQTPDTGAGTLTAAEQAAADAALLAAVAANAAGATTDTAAAGATAGGDEVLGVTVTADGAAGLAVTGSDVNMPVAVGAVLIGSGGLLIAAARKRERNNA